jgi:hypothetical protein
MLLRSHAASFALLMCPPALEKAEVLWTEDIVTTYTPSASRYEYGIKIEPSAMVEEFLAPPPADAEDESLPQAFPVLAKTVKTEEQLAQEEEDRRLAEEAKLAAEAEKKKAAKVSPCERKRARCSSA